MGGHKSCLAQPEQKREEIRSVVVQPNKKMEDL